MQGSSSDACRQRTLGKLASQGEGVSHDHDLLNGVQLRSSIAPTRPRLSPRHDGGLSWAGWRGGKFFRTTYTFCRSLGTRVATGRTRS
eukprot:1836244-Prymnesium_polylepis.2